LVGTATHPTACKQPLASRLDVLLLPDSLGIPYEPKPGPDGVLRPKRSEENHHADDPERPDIVLMDIRMPGVDGLEATRRITSEERLANVRVIMPTTFELDEYVFEALHAGASGFLLKDFAPEELRDAVRVIAQGEVLLAPSVTKRLIREFVAQPGRHRPPPERLEKLTEREREVMALVATGLSNQEIAERLVISPATAKTHVSRTMMKLHARDRAQLVVLAYETGLVRVPE
jgi:DNA-binding NarL/FixJ family response regulator